MAYYAVNKTDSTQVALVPERQSFTVGGVSLLGKNYYSYGEVMAENMVKMTENFSSTQPPINPLGGQLWYDSSHNQLKVKRLEQWIPLMQDIGSATITGFDYTTIKDTYGGMHEAIKIKVNNITIAIISSDSFIPNFDTGLQTAFPTIGQGINLNYSSTYGNYKLRGRSIEAEFADMAEIYQSDIELEPGNIVKLGGACEITKTNTQYDDQVFGIISTAPGLLLNSKEKLKEFAYPVALKGRVPCIVTGSVKKGQRIVASDIAGVGMATDRFELASIVGRALGEKTSTGLGTVEVSVGVR